MRVTRGPHVKAAPTFTDHTHFNVHETGKHYRAKNKFTFSILQPVYARLLDEPDRNGSIQHAV